MTDVLPARRIVGLCHLGGEPRRPASIAISAGGNIKAIQHLLEHRTASITLDRYGHLYEDDLADLADRLDGRLRDLA